MLRRRRVKNANRLENHYEQAYQTPEPYEPMSSVTAKKTPYVDVVEHQQTPEQLPRGS